jgi:CBS domain-containing protein
MPGPEARTRYDGPMKGHARDIMSAHVERVGPNVPLGELAERLVDANVGGLPVVESGERVIGFVNNTDVISALLAGKPADTPAREVMTPAEVIDEFATTDEVIAILKTRSAHHLPVVRSGRLVGIIAPRDVLRFFVERVAPTRPEAG